MRCPDWLVYKCKVVDDNGRKEKQEVSETEIKRDTAVDSIRIKLLHLVPLFALFQAYQQLELMTHSFLPGLRSSYHERMAVIISQCPNTKLFRFTEDGSGEKKPLERNIFLLLLLSQFLCIFSNSLFKSIIAFYERQRYNIICPNIFIFRPFGYQLEVSESR